MRASKSEAVRRKILGFVPMYATRRAALLPALHVVQNALGRITWQAMKELAELLEIPPSQVLDVVTFYNHFWTGRRGRKVIVVCRSLTCHVMGSQQVLDALKRYLGIDEHETTADGEWSLVTEECLGACEHGPCMLIGERLYTRVRPEDVPGILADPDCDRLPDTPRSSLYDAPEEDASG